MQLNPLRKPVYRKIHRYIPSFSLVHLDFYDWVLFEVRFLLKSFQKSTIYRTLYEWCLELRCLVFCCAFEIMTILETSMHIKFSCKLDKWVPSMLEALSVNP